MAWWNRDSKIDDKDKLDPKNKRSAPRGMWLKCAGCGEALLADDLVMSLRVCPKCEHHFAMPIPERLQMLMDPNSFEEEDADFAPVDPLGFSDLKPYPKRVAAAREKSGAPDAFLSGRGRIESRDVAVGFFVYDFIGGSMGSVVGEKVKRLFERARERGHPALVFSASGGARMQEGILSLMQMAKTTAARARLREARIPYISVLLHPTTGGVAASFAMLGDVNVAEPGALIGFAGPRVIEQTIGEKLPEGFQRSEFLLEHGMLDMIVHRRDLRSRISQLLEYLG